MMPSSLLDSRIKLRHLSCFLEVTRQGGVVAASEVPGLSQPAVSKSMGELEDLLGAALFDRGGRKLVLSTQGQIFARHAMTAAAAIRQGIDSLDLARANQTVVRLGALPTVEVEVVPRAVALFAAGPLACRVVVESGPSPYLLGRLREGGVDFIVGRMPSPAVMTGLVFELLYSEGLTFAVRARHPLARRRALSYRQIEPFTLLMPPEGAIIRPTLDAMAMAGGLGSVASRIETVSNSFARAYTLGNDAIWIISQSVVAPDLATGQLVALDLDTSASNGPVGITLRTGVEPTPAASCFMTALRRVAKDVAADREGT